MWFRSWAKNSGDLVEDSVHCALDGGSRFYQGPSVEAVQPYGCFGMRARRRRSQITGNVAEWIRDDVYGVRSALARSYGRNRKGRRCGGSGASGMEISRGRVVDVALRRTSVGLAGLTTGFWICIHGGRERLEYVAYRTRCCVKAEQECRLCGSWFTNSDGGSRVQLE